MSFIEHQVHRKLMHRKNFLSEEDEPASHLQNEHERPPNPRRLGDADIP
jgi:hypothetical protein